MSVWLGFYPSSSAIEGAVMLDAKQDVVDRRLAGTFLQRSYAASV